MKENERRMSKKYVWFKHRNEKGEKKTMQSEKLKGF